ncbi:hypothetical protein FGO68_gene17479 [Halteria grandinella]|uniref:Uncharacterized protein n=1 Tax=Halteria grandinella TaxID=5974 RepID=A0A8J8SZV3_HALGN|nr:hypothetical protein FGO68_gene17479 [Halteria grandinella]
MEQLINTSASPLEPTAFQVLHSLPPPHEDLRSPSHSLIPITPSPLLPNAYNPTLPYCENLRRLCPDANQDVHFAAVIWQPVLYDLRTLIDEATQLIGNEAPGKIAGLMLVKRAVEAPIEQSNDGVESMQCEVIPSLEIIEEEKEERDSTMTEVSEPDSPKVTPRRPKKKRKCRESTFQMTKNFPSGSDDDTMHQIITRQLALIQEWQESQVQFKTKEIFLTQTMDKLNKIATDAGFEPMVSSNGFGKPKYSSIICKGCNKPALLWFTFKKCPSGEGDEVCEIQYFRPPYGLAMHKDIKSHLQNVNRK